MSNLMSNLDWLSFASIDTSSGTVTLSFVAAAIGAALLGLFLLLAVFRTSASEVVWTVTRVGLVVVVAASAWLFFGRAIEHDRTEDRRALDQRIQELSGRATEPGSALGCLDTTMNEALETVCEKVIFGNPATIAAATVFVASQLALLSDAVDYINRGDPAYSPAIAGLRRAVETDRFGLVAQVLATRHGCTAAKCTQLAMLSDATRVSDHLKDGTFDGLVARYATIWPQMTSQSTVAAAPPSMSYGQSPLPPTNAPPGAATTNDRTQDALAPPKRAAVTTLRPPPPRIAHPPAAKPPVPLASPGDGTDTQSRDQ
jgi:membrane protein implicated in regulation of membrane protease activity